VLVPSARQTKYGDQRAKPGGRVPGDVWAFPRVCGTFKERAGHVCQTALALLERVVLVASNPGDLVLEPFAGWPGKTAEKVPKHADQTGV
jgi:site-specific DNA-methyltransferase (adenine-specific)